MNTFKSILSICFLISLGIAIGQTSLGKGLYNETVYWIKNNPVNNTVKDTFESAKVETKKVKNKIQVKYQEIKEDVKSDNEPKKALIVPKTHNGMEIVRSVVKGKSLFIVADKEGLRCEYLQSPNAKYSRCYHKVSSK